MQKWWREIFIVTLVVLLALVGLEYHIAQHRYDLSYAWYRYVVEKQFDDVDRLDKERKENLATIEALKVKLRVLRSKHERSEAE